MLKLDGSVLLEDCDSVTVVVDDDEASTEAVEFDLGVLEIESVIRGDFERLAFTDGLFAVDGKTNVCDGVLDEFVETVTLFDDAVVMYARIETVLEEDVDGATLAVELDDGAIVTDVSRETVVDVDEDGKNEGVELEDDLVVVVVDGV